ncbi:sensor histidine kinase [Humidisolicoccus flavus]|uniref:sensor histidine kinase n=1 Tax=Humidisolicoccus flavus TaxID=3111414 RepID=UPI0032496151
MTPDPDARKRRFRAPVVSVRTRIVSVIAVITALGMLAAGVTAFLVERSRILEQIDTQLMSSLQSAEFIVSEDQAASWTDAPTALRSVVQRHAPDDNTGTLGIVDGKSTWVPGVGVHVALESVPGFVDRIVAEVRAGGTVMGTYAVDGLALRYIATSITIDGVANDQEAIFVTAYDVNAEFSELTQAAQAYVISSSIILLIIVIVAFLISGRLLRPIRTLRLAADRISESSLDERIPVTGNDDVSQLTTTVNAMLDRLDHSATAQRRLFSDVGHELKTPITIVRGHLELMDAKDPSDVAAARELAIDELDRMAGLVQDIARASSLESAAPLRPSPVDVGELTSLLVQKSAALGGATIEQGETAHVVAVLDGERITQAVIQLVQNAITHAAGPIVIGSRVESDAVVFSVRDHGPGIPDADKERIFERFMRGSTPTPGAGSAGPAPVAPGAAAQVAPSPSAAPAPKAPGTGLGLAIVRMIARAHGGSVVVRDAATDSAGTGSVFSLRVPLMHAQPPAHHLETKEPRGIDTDR